MNPSTQINPLISVIVTRSQREDLFAENLKSIHNQGLGEHEYEVIHWQQQAYPYPSAQVQRNSGFESSKGNIVVFLDEDCALPSESLLTLQLLYQKHPEICAIGGSYISHSKTSWAGHIYNKVCQLWQTSASKELPHLLGGALSLKKTKDLPEPLFSDQFPFGGEEIAFVANLQKKNLKAAYLPEWKVFHKAQHQIKDLLKRSSQHARAKYQLNTLLKLDLPSNKKSKTHIILKICKESELKQLALLPFALGYILLTNLIVFFYYCLEWRPGKTKATDAL